MTSDGPSVIDLVKSNHQNVRRPNDLKIKILGHLRRPDITSFGLNILEKNSEYGIISSCRVPKGGGVQGGGVTAEP